MADVAGTMKISAFSQTDYIPFRELFFISIQLTATLAKNNHALLFANLAVKKMKKANASHCTFRKKAVRQLANNTGTYNENL